MKNVISIALACALGSSVAVASGYEYMAYATPQYQNPYYNQQTAPVYQNPQAVYQNPQPVYYEPYPQEYYTGLPQQYPTYNPDYTHNPYPVYPQPVYNQPQQAYAQPYQPAPQQQNQYAYAQPVYNQPQQQYQQPNQYAQPQYQQPQQQYRQQAQNYTNNNQAVTQKVQQPKPKQQPKKVKKKLNTAGTINQITKFITDQLSRNRDFKNIAKSKIAVASFVMAENIGKTNRLGRMISDNLLHDLQIRGYDVLDYKTSIALQVSDSGSFIFTNDTKKMKKKQEINYVVSGTMEYYGDGVTVNARIIKLKDNKVVSTAQAFIPSHVVAEVLDTLDPYMAFQSKGMSTVRIVSE
jgi:TolB-like protein